MADYLLPDVGEGLTEAEIVAWRVKEGDTVQINDIVVEIETAKSLVELPSPYAGVVTALLVPEGETVAVGTPIISIGDPSEKPAEAPAPAAPAAEDFGEIDLSNPAASGGGEGESLVGRNKADRGPDAPRRARAPPHPSTDAAAATQMQVQGAFAPGGAQSQDVVESDEPAVPRRRRPSDARTVAPTCGCWPSLRCASWPRTSASTCTSVTGTGPARLDHPRRRHIGGRGGPPGRLEAAMRLRDARWRSLLNQPAERERREPIKGVRKMMGQAMVDSAFTAPHVTEWVTVDVTRTMEFVERLKRAGSSGTSRSPRCWCWPGRACSRCGVRRRSTRSGTTQTQEIVFKCYVNLGIAAATPARARRTQRQGRRAALPASTSPPRSTSSPPPRARARPSRPR